VTDLEFAIFATLALAMVISVIAALRSSSAADRIVAFDVFATALLCGYVIRCSTTGEVGNFALFAVWAATSFVGHVAIAKITGAK
jgi:multisubunit Na+/H+ antiporter MnhF subunit